MTDKPKFTVIDRRKAKAEAEEEQSQGTSEGLAQPIAEGSPTDSKPADGHVSPGPRLVVSEPTTHSAVKEETPRESGRAGLESSRAGLESEADLDSGAALPPPPTAEESRIQKIAYDASSQRLDDLVRAQNPAAGAPPVVNFESLLQQLYVAAMMQMGAGTPEGQRPRIDILGARQTIDLLGLLAEKTRGHLSAGEDSALQSVVFEARMAFLELTKMITLQSVAAPPPPPPGKF